MKNYSSKQNKKDRPSFRTPSTFIARKAINRKSLLRKPGGK